MGWPTEKFGKVCVFVRGPFGGALKKSIFKESGYAVYEQQHAIKNQFERIRYFVDEEKFSEMSRFELCPGDLIMSCSGTMGKIAIVPIGISKGIINQALLKLTPKKTMSPEFLKFWMESRNFQEQIESLAQGVAIQNMASVKILKEIQVPTPELNVQKHIVEILHDAFANIDHARQLAEHNLKNARELFNSTLDQIFTRSNDAWNTNNLKNLTTKIGSGATPRGGKDSYKDSGIPLIRSLNVHDRTFRKKDLAFLDDAQAAKLDNVIVQSGDVLLNITGASVARCCVAPDEHLPARVNQHVSIIRPKPNQLLPEFLNYLLTSKHYKDQLLGIGEAGSTRQAITKAQLESFDLSYPGTLSEQQSIAEKVRELQKQTERLEAIYRQKIIALYELKQSLLQKAFRGELTQEKAAA